jgi:hypothetical protein
MSTDSVRERLEYNEKEWQIKLGRTSQGQIAWARPGTIGTTFRWYVTVVDQDGTPIRKDPTSTNTRWSYEAVEDSTMPIEINCRNWSSKCLELYKEHFGPYPPVKLMHEMAPVEIADWIKTLDHDAHVDGFGVITGASLDALYRKIGEKKMPGSHKPWIPSSVRRSGKTNSPKKPGKTGDTNKSNQQDHAKPSNQQGHAKTSGSESFGLDAYFQGQLTEPINWEAAKAALSGHWTKMIRKPVEFDESLVKMVYEQRRDNHQVVMENPLLVSAAREQARKIKMKCAWTEEEMNDFEGSCRPQ